MRERNASCLRGGRGDLFNNRRKFGIATKVFFYY